MNTNFEKSYPLPQGIVYNAEKNWYELVADAADDRLDVLDYYGEMWDCWQKAMQVASKSVTEAEKYYFISPLAACDVGGLGLDTENPELLKPELKSTACLRFLGRLPCHCDFCLENNHE